MSHYLWPTSAEQFRAPNKKVWVTNFRPLRWRPADQVHLRILEKEVIRTTFFQIHVMRGLQFEVWRAFFDYFKHFTQAGVIGNAPTVPKMLRMQPQAWLHPQQFPNQGQVIDGTCRPVGHYLFCLPCWLLFSAAGMMTLTISWHLAQMFSH